MIWCLIISLLVFAVGAMIGTYAMVFVAAGIVTLTLFFPRLGNTFKDPVKVSVFLFFLSLIFIGLGTFLCWRLGSNVVFYLFVLLSGVTAGWPLLLSRGIFLLWWNPEKYKEYEMKEARRRRKLADELEKIGKKEND